MSAARHVCLFALLAAVPALAADPVEPEDPVAWRRMLPEDVDAVIVIDYKALVSSPLVKKVLKGKLSKVFSPAELKPMKIDPLKDIRRVVIVSGRGFWEAGSEDLGFGGPVLVVETGKSSAALRTALDAAAREEGPFKATDEDKERVYQPKAGPHSYFAVLPGGALAVAQSRAAALAALARAKAGTWTRKFKHREVAKFARGIKESQVISGLVLGDAVVSASSFRAGGEKPKVTLHTLAESGFTSARIAATLKDTIKGKVELGCKDKDAAEKKLKELNGGLELARMMTEKQADKEPKAKDILRMLKSIKGTVSGKTLAVEGEAGTELFDAVEWWFTPVAVKPPKGADPKVQEKPAAGRDE
jgi:hypothetical protein